MRLSEPDFEFRDSLWISNWLFIEFNFTKILHSKCKPMIKTIGHKSFCIIRILGRYSWRDRCQFFVAHVLPWLTIKAISRSKLHVSCPKFKKTKINNYQNYTLRRLVFASLVHFSTGPSLYFHFYNISTGLQPDNHICSIEHQITHQHEHCTSCIFFASDNRKLCYHQYILCKCIQTSTHIDSKFVITFQDGFVYIIYT